jgi:F-type H+-transporting ATPase subunit alpha
VGISVSRVGGSAQTKAIKQVAARLRMDMAAYRELAAFAQFGSDLDKVTQSQLNRGQRLQEILKQPQYSPYSLASQVIALFAATNGYADATPVEHVRSWEAALLRFMESSYPDIIKDIHEKKQITQETEKTLRQAIETFNSTWQAA